jgi:G:T/U-mismatch repair DNA glycosylase
MKKYNSESRKNHPFKLFAENNPNFLVIGSFPTTDNLMSFDFYYPNASNKFWETMSQVFPYSATKLNLKVSVKDKVEVREKNKKDREDFCRENKIAITDMIASCIRMNDNSEDSQLLVHRYTDIIEVLRNNKSITRIILTAKSLGSSVNHHFYQFLTMREIDFEFDERRNIPKGMIDVDGRKISIASIASTSNRNSHVTDEELVEFYEQAFTKDKLFEDAT